LDEPPGDDAAVGAQGPAVEPAVLALRVLVAEVDVAVGGDRLSHQQVVRLVAGEAVVVGAVYAQRSGVDPEQHQPQDARPATAHAQAPRARAITICCTSSVPSPIVRIFASR